MDDESDQAPFRLLGVLYAVVQCTTTQFTIKVSLTDKGKKHEANIN